MVYTPVNSSVAHAQISGGGDRKVGQMPRGDG